LTLAQLAEQIDAEVVGDGKIPISAVATLEEATFSQVSFLSNPVYAKLLQTTKAGAVIVNRKTEAEHLNLLRAADPYLAYKKAVVALHGYRQHPHLGIHLRATVEPTASIGEASVLYPGVYVGANAKIGRDCVLYPNVVIYDNCILGDRVIVHAGASIGHDGFGFATSKGIHHKIPQVGNVVVEDDVEIGASAMIARAAIGSTLIAKGTKIDALVAVGHGVKVGEHCLLVSQTGIAGSTTIGHHVTLGGQVGVAGHLTIGDNVTVAAQGGIIADVPDKSVLIGSPAMPYTYGRRVYLLFTKLPELLERIQQLEEKLAEMTAKELK
jgi:UDP-3-O-[3-hydroxymyristoyl] glucosamine N-acyltransferase